MNNSEIIELLKQYKKRTANLYGINRIGVFGSYAKRASTEKSDIDIVVELQYPDIFKLVHIKEELQELFGVRIDIVRKRKNMNQYLKKHIEKVALYV